MARIANNDANLTAFIGMFEGNRQYIYGDSLALPTIGIGHLVGGRRAATATEVENDAVAIHHRFGFHFRPGLGVGAPSDADVRQEVQRFLAEGDPQRRNVRHLLARVVRLELSEASCRDLFDRDVRVRLDNLFTDWPKLATTPHQVQIAMIDLGFNGGIPGLLRRAELRDVVDHWQWHTAADRLAHGGPDGISRRAWRNNSRAKIVRDAPPPTSQPKFEHHGAGR